MNGLLLIDKPEGMSSFDVIRKLRAVTGIRKIGHAGTLDPLASGLLLVLVGRTTKQAPKFIKLDKSYQAEITLGAVSATDDREGKLTPVNQQKPDEGMVETALSQLVGTIKQTPPAYSAVKIGGQRAYKLARAGATPVLPTRSVKVYALRLLVYRYPLVVITANVSSGTYIRSLARDLGEKLGTGAYLSNLKRTKIGTYDVADSLSLAGLKRATIKQRLKSL